MRPARLHPSTLPARTWFASLAFASIFAGMTAAQESSTSASSLAKKLPGTDLVVYIEIDGFDAHSKEWKSSAAYKALNQTTLGVLLEDLAAQGLDFAMKGKVTNPPKGAEVVKVIELAARKGIALSVNGKPPGEPTFTLVLRGGTSPEILGMLKRLHNSDPEKSSTKGTRKISTFGEKPTDDVFIEDKGDLVITTQANLDPTLQNLDGKGVNVAANANYTELSKAEGTFQPIALAFVDVKGFGPLPPQAAALGLDGLKRLDYRWGVKDTALYSVFRILAPSPRKGVLALFDGPTFDKATLPALPAGLNEFTVMTLSPGQLYDKVTAVVRQSAPNGDQQVAAVEQMAQQVLGVRLKEDFLAKLGPKWSVYSGAAEPAAGGMPVNMVATTELADSAKFAAVLDRVLQVVNMQMKMQGGPNAANKPVPQFQKLAGAQPGFEMIFPAGMLPPNMASIKPTILIGKKSLVIGSTSKGAAAALTVVDGSGARWKPDAVYTKVLDTLPKGVVFLSVSDPRDSLPKMISQLPLLLASASAAMIGQGGQALPIKIDPAKMPKSADLSKQLFPAYQAMTVDAKGINVISREALPGIGNPATVAVGTALLLPAVQASREAARRAQCVNNEKQMMLAMMNFESATGTYPGNIVSKQGKPLLSWRVAILPYLEEKTLYDKFKLDEPWDSANNKPLIAEMAKVYACPSRSATEPGLTYYQGFSGKGTLFADPKKPTGIANITDGTSNTIAIVESSEPVIWSKPDDIEFDPKANVPLLGAGSTHPGGFNAALCDGSVRFIKTTINPETLKKLITINGGEVINANDY